jgi:hypothetical protein
MAGRSCGRYDRSGSAFADSCDDAEYIALICGNEGKIMFNFPPLKKQQRNEKKRKRK